MPNALVLNCAEDYGLAFPAKGELTQTFCDKAVELFQKKGYEVKTTVVAQGYDVEEELEKWQWADVVFVQTPIFWFNVSSAFKRYQDLVFTPGMSGQLCIGDGRRRGDGPEKYGSSGTRVNTKYVLSVTFNAPEGALNNTNNFLLNGKGIDDIFVPLHIVFKFFGMQQLPSIGSFNVVKDLQLQKDLDSLETYFGKHF